MINKQNEIVFQRAKNPSSDPRRLQSLEVMLNKNPYFAVNSILPSLYFHFKIVKKKKKLNNNNLTNYGFTC